MSKRNAPNPKVEGAGKKNGGTSLLTGISKKVNQQEPLNLYKARGRYPSGPAWRTFLTTVSHREVLLLLGSAAVEVDDE